MLIRYHPIERFPSLAWICAVNRPERRADVLHGRHVETRPSFFVEGLWGGSFEDGAFDASDSFFGSGGIAKDEAITFVPSYATTDSLHYKDDGRIFAISNSLSLLLGHLSDGLDPSCTEYPSINDSVIAGIYGYARDIPTAGGGVRRLMHANVTVDGAGASAWEKPMPPGFPTYSSYASYLAERTQAMMINARSAARRKPMRVFSTQSRGYDTTAANAIAGRFGIDAAFTVRQSKAQDRSALDDEAQQGDDDGTEICKSLGIPVIPLDRRAFAGDFSDEHLFYAGFHRADDANMLGIKPHIASPCALITGALGEIWYTEMRYPKHTMNAALKRWDPAGHGMGEWRLEAGFVQVALPFLGARRREDIYRITHSDEMGPWRLDVPYDRPLARRIAEEAGVPRAMFGQKKLASIVNLPEPAMPWNPGLRSAFFDFLVASGLCSRPATMLMPLVLKFNEARRYYSPRNRYWLFYYLERLVALVSRNKSFKMPIMLRHLDGTLYCFCVNTLARHYRRMLDESVRGEPAPARGTAPVG